MRLFPIAVCPEGCRGAPVALPSRGLPSPEGLNVAPHRHCRLTWDCRKSQTSALELLLPTPQHTAFPEDSVMAAGCAHSVSFRAGVWETALPLWLLEPRVQAAGSTVAFVVSFSCIPRLGCDVGPGRQAALPRWCPAVSCPTVRVAPPPPGIGSLDSWGPSRSLSSPSLG